MWNKTRATKLLKIKHPIIQGPFGGRFSSVELLSTVSNLGGLGSFGLNSYSPDEIIEVDKEIRRFTNNPYALNLWVPLKDDPAINFSTKDFVKLKEKFRPYFDEMNLPLPNVFNPKTQDFELQIESLLKVKPPVASFIFGIPSKEIILELKKRKIICMATATTLEEALTIEEAEIDLVIASGVEAGGHRASFIGPAEQSLTKTPFLIRQIVDKISIPVVAAGGISNGKDIKKVFKLGAAAAQLGTAFLATNESNASAVHKSKLLATEPFQTNLTKVFTGRLARTISNRLSKDFDTPHNAFIAPYPIQGSFLSSLRNVSIEQNNPDYVAFWSGQPSSILKYTSAAELFKALVLEASK